MTTSLNSTNSAQNIKKDKINDFFLNKLYFYAVGRRKTAIAQVRLYKDGKGRVYVNQKEYRKVYPYFDTQKIINRALEAVKEKQNIDISAYVKGGGFSSQSEAISLGIARALLKLNPDYKERLRQAGFLTRDARIKERKKPGLKRARRAPQWSKR